MFQSIKGPEAMSEQNATDDGQETTLATNSPRRAIAPWWHTVLLVVPLLGFSLLGGLRSAHLTIGQRHLPQYAATLVWEWLLAGFVLWGIRMRRTPLRQLLGVRRPTLRDWRDDVVIAAVFWITSMMI